MLLGDVIKLDIFRRLFDVSDDLDVSVARRDLKCKNIDEFGLMSPSVTRTGKISTFGQFFRPWVNFLSKKEPKILGRFFVKG